LTWSIHHFYPEPLVLMAVLAGGGKNPQLPSQFCPCSRDEDQDVYYWCQEGNLEKVQGAFVREEVDRLDEEGEGLLHWAVDRGHVEIVRFLLANGADVDLVDVNGQSPLFFAVLCESEELVTLLLEAGANPSAVDEDGSSVLDLASSKIRALFPAIPGHEDVEERDDEDEDEDDDDEEEKEVTGSEDQQKQSKE